LDTAGKGKELTVARRRDSDVELSFDSMTDLVTNLAGGLILVVLLLMGMTRNAQPVVEDKSVRQLYELANELRAEIQAVDQHLRRSEEEVDMIRREVEALLQSAKRTQLSDSPGKDAKESDAP
jgi:hypothetical protein